MTTDFKALEARAKKTRLKRVALAMAEEANALSAVLEAWGEGIAEPVLVGSPEAIHEAAKEVGVKVDGLSIVAAEGGRASAEKAVELIREGKADCLMKGKAPTAVIMKAALNKERGIRGPGILSHAAIIKPPSYHKLLIFTDAALNIAPDLEDKAAILNNALSVARKLGVEKPKAAVIGAVELVNPAMPATLDAAILSKMAHRGQFENCLVDGPFSLDNALSARSCRGKGIATEVGGDADILLLPDVEAANVLYKALSVLTDFPLAGLIAGARKPIILTSRTDSDQVKYDSILAGISLS